MTAEDVYACVLNRGMRPTVKAGVLSLGDEPTLFRGAPTGLTPALAAAVRLHEPAIRRLVALGWTPKIVSRGDAKAVAAERGRDPVHAGALTPTGYRVLPFDREAEAAVRELYAIDYGVRPREGGGWKVFPAEPCYKLDVVWRRIKPLWERVRRHLDATAGELLEFRQARDGEVVAVGLNRLPLGQSNPWRRHYHHWFESAARVTFDAYRVCGELEWRALWGRHVAAHRYAKMEWVPWGGR